VIGDFHEPYGAVLVGGIWYSIQSTSLFLRAVTIAASSADRLFLRQSIRKGRVAATKLHLNDHDHQVTNGIPSVVSAGCYWPDKKRLRGERAVSNTVQRFPS
jgi:hypothetical protein